jgi:hypothetical protein
MIFESTQGGTFLQMPLTSSPAAVRAVFALQVVVTVLAFLVFLIVASLAALLFLRRRSRHASRKTSPKGTFAFLSIGVLCLAIAQAATAASVALQTNSSSPASITHAFSLHYQGSSSNSAGEASTTSVSLSFLNAFAFIISTVCLNGAVWLHSSHATANGLAVGQPSRLSIVGNTLLLLVMTATGFASWGLAVSSYTADQRYGNVLQDNLPSRTVYTVFRACVVGSTVSVAIEAIRRYVQVKNHSSRDVCSNTSPTPANQIATNTSPGIRTPHPFPPCTPRRSPASPPQRFHHPRHRAPLGGQHLPNLEHNNARSDSLPAHHFRPIC